jgi:hypothetical protein
MDNRLLHERDASREAGDLLAKAVVASNPSPELAAAVFRYMEAEACVDAKFYALMHLKMRLVRDLFTFLARRAAI